MCRNYVFEANCAELTAAIDPHYQQQNVSLGIKLLAMYGNISAQSGDIGRYVRVKLVQTATRCGAYCRP